MKLEQERGSLENHYASMKQSVERSEEERFALETEKFKREQ